MKECVSVLDSVICINEIKKITINYYSGTNYSNDWLHILLIEYKDGKIEYFRTTNISKAKMDYEVLKDALLNYERNKE